MSTLAATRPGLLPSYTRTHPHPSSSNPPTPNTSNSVNSLVANTSSPLTQSESPLATLVRRTSSRRVRAAQRDQRPQLGKAESLESPEIQRTRTKVPKVQSPQSYWVDDYEHTPSPRSDDDAYVYADADAYAYEGYDYQGPSVSKDLSTAQQQDYISSHIPSYPESRPPPPPQQRLVKPPALHLNISPSHANAHSDSPAFNSPLLHGQFLTAQGRDSTYADSYYSNADEQGPGHGHTHALSGADSPIDPSSFPIPKSSTSAPFQSQSKTNSTASGINDIVDRYASFLHEDDASVYSYSDALRESSTFGVGGPAVIVSVPDDSSGSQQQPTAPLGLPTVKAGRAPILRTISGGQVTTNFSRPARSSGSATHTVPNLNHIDAARDSSLSQFSHASRNSQFSTYSQTSLSESVREKAQAMGERVVPQLPEEMRMNGTKKAVLERNAGRHASGHGGPPQGVFRPSPLGRENEIARGPSPSPAIAPVAGSGTAGMSTTQPRGYDNIGPGTHANTSMLTTIHTPPTTSTSSFMPPPTTPSSSRLSPTSGPGVHLHAPPSRSGSPAGSVYSQYSYYQYDTPVPSPISPGVGNVITGSNPNQPSLSPNSRSKTPTQASPNPHPTTSGPPPSDPGALTPIDYLHIGIQHHEANRLQESVRFFERSANESGGCGVGMLMYGLALRHGWGCAKNEALGFRWVRKAAESAVGDLEKLRQGGADAGGIGVNVQAELVLAIYEVGQCFFHGWGVPKDQKMGVSYYTVAARLGDSDAQGDLAFCLANGKGCKKDKKEAARWYRKAVEQGLSDVGLAWIYKEKYQ